MRASGTSDAKPATPNVARSARRVTEGKAEKAPSHEAATNTAATLSTGTRAGQIRSHHNANPARRERRDKPRSSEASCGADVTGVD